MTKTIQEELPVQKWRKYPSDSKEKKNEYARRYLLKNPWARKYKTSWVNAKRKNLQHTMCASDFKELWFRDKAYLLSSPSIDRIDRFQGYVKENCRYIELRENKARNNRDRIASPAQREASRKKLQDWHKKQKYEKEHRV